ncbi:hypothetical protein SK128_026116, partial [Halocaridina rubra]
MLQAWYRRLCYDVNDKGDALNIFGVIRLLNIIAKQCPFFKLSNNWEEIIYQTIPTTYASVLQRQQRPVTANNDSQNNTNRNRNYDRHRQLPSIRNNNEIRNVSQESSNDQHSRRDPQQHSDGRHTRDFRHQNRQIPPGIRGWRRDSRMNRSLYDLDQPRRYPQRPREREKLQQLYSRRQPCSNCGEINHDLSHCWFNYRLKC